jgi:p-hydroxybenzoate 3-monooxygenase
MHTQVAIIGAGPAGLLLSHLLHLEGIDSIVLERQNRAYVEARVRAGVLEQGTVDLLVEAGLGDRLKREGLVHHGIELSFSGRRHRIDMTELTGGRAITVYGQNEVIKDLIAARLAAGGDIRFDIADVRIGGIDTDRPVVRFTEAGANREITCDFIGGCDGFHGICRQSVPAADLSLFDRVYPFGWLGVLVQAPPASEEIIYSRHDDGFALFSMRSPEITRLYLQCDPDEDIANWPDGRIWEALHKRLESSGDWRLAEGPVLEKGITAMRGFVAEPMRHGRLFLAGDAAHIVPPTGAKGMNLAVADVRVLSRALSDYFKRGATDSLEAYSATCLRRVWKAQRFSWQMTSMLHKFPGVSLYDERVQFAELDYVVSSEAAARSLAENYVGLPFD